VGLPGQLAQLPGWGNTRTFIKVDANLQPPAPIAYSTDPSSEMYKVEMEVYN
jgi:hypothetical protein